ncbi:MAG TPA: hypothetical protein VNE21_07180 [Mycobacteriales bacterium]|nr:hypothetical protein [Mycobacteriales bacterium]
MSLRDQRLTPIVSAAFPGARPLRPDDELPVVVPPLAEPEDVRERLAAWEGRYRLDPRTVDLSALTVVAEKAALVAALCGTPRPRPTYPSAEAVAVRIDGLDAVVLRYVRDRWGQRWTAPCGRWTGRSDFAVTGPATWSGAQRVDLMAWADEGERLVASLGRANGKGRVA